MSFGALSEPAKIALARGAELAGTGICSGEGGMLPEEQEANSRYFYELASARFGFDWDKLAACRRSISRAARAPRPAPAAICPGTRTPARSPRCAAFPRARTRSRRRAFPTGPSPSQIKAFADEVRDRTGGIPIGYKLSAQHIEKDIDAALEVGVDYIILDGRGGGTGAAPILFRDNISVPTIPALARARRHLDRLGARRCHAGHHRGLRKPADFIKAMALGADAIAVSNAAMQAIGCIAMRACHTNNCPVGIATQKPHLVSRIVVEKSAANWPTFFEASVELMQVMARACGHDHLSEFNQDDLTTWKKDMADLSGVAYGGVA
jgi:glutamate synthase domain-containing protein 2